MRYPQYTIYTSGGRSWNRAAWACSMRDEHGGYWEEAGVLNGEEYTAKQAELSAAILVLSQLPWPAQVKIHSESKYVACGMGKWIGNWRDHGWRNRKGKPVRNQDVLKELLLLAPLYDSERHVEWILVMRDSDEGIQRVGQLVKQALKSGRKGSELTVSRVASRVEHQCGDGRIHETSR